MSLDLERLRRRLGGAYDLDKAEDCLRAVEVLLCSESAANARERETDERLRTLAMMVLNANPAAKEEARKVLASPGSGNAMGLVCAMAARADEAKAMKDDDLTDEVMEKVWAKTDMGSVESALLSELMERFGRMRKGLTA